MRFRESRKLALMARLAALLLAPAVLGGCVVAADYPPRAHVAYYDYYYYPHIEVYFDPRGNYWYYRDGHRWHRDRHLPPRFGHHHRSHRVKIRGREPWDHHDEWRRRYPGDRDRDRDGRRGRGDRDHDRDWDRDRDRDRDGRRGDHDRDRDRWDDDDQGRRGDVDRERNLDRAYDRDRDRGRERDRDRIQDRDPADDDLRRRGGDRDGALAGRDRRPAPAADRGRSARREADQRRRAPEVDARDGGKDRDDEAQRRYRNYLDRRTDG